MYKTIWKGKPVEDTYANLCKLTEGYIGEPFIKIK